MTENEKPDGWVAWHPEKDFMLCSLTDERKWTFQIMSDQLDASGEDSDDWRIRPVKLVFLDEAKDE